MLPNVARRTLHTLPLLDITCATLGVNGLSYLPDSQLNLGHLHNHPAACVIVWLLLILGYWLEMPTL